MAISIFGYGDRICEVVNNSNNNNDDEPEAVPHTADAHELAGEEFALIAARYREYLRRVVQARLDDRLTARVDSSDLIQETLAEAVRRIRLGKAESPLPMRLWLRQLAIDQIRMAERKHLHSTKRSIHKETPISGTSSVLLAQDLLKFDVSQSQPHEDLIRAEQVQAACQALAKLPHDFQEILTLRVFEGLSYAEIALLIEVPSATARKRFGRALIHLHQLLGGQVSE